MLQFDHLQIASVAPEAEAKLYAELVGAPPPVREGQDGNMFRIALDHGACLLYAEAKAPPAMHFALRVDEARFAQIVARLKARGIAYGNDHERPGGGETADPLGGKGRIYWFGRDGHLYEVAC